MSGNGKLLTPRQYAEMNGVAYTTVMHWLQAGKVEWAVKRATPFGHYWELPDDAPRPKKLSGRPKKTAANSAKKSKKGAK
jgi:predicted site-specific integrase-resolvase